jgi:hypothetical protein
MPAEAHEGTHGARATISVAEATEHLGVSLGNIYRLAQGERRGWDAVRRPEPCTLCCTRSGEDHFNPAMGS